MGSCKVDESAFWRYLTTVQNMCALVKCDANREKYDALVSGQAAREQLLLAQIEEHKKKVGVLEEYVELLEKKVKVISERHPDSIPKEASDSNYNHLRFYQMMTGMMVSSDPSEPLKVLCTVKNPQKRQLTRFYIENFPNNDAEISFMPEANPDFLPEYLRSGVTFDKLLAPLMLGDILQILFGESSD